MFEETIDIEQNRNVYYACSQCNLWHTPGSEIWKQHLHYIDLEETNSNRPKYFWCKLHNKSHDLQRKCLPYKAVIIYKDKKTTVGNPTISKSHDDVLDEIKRLVSSKNLHKNKLSRSIDWGKCQGTTNLPWKCTRGTCLIKPDIVYCKQDESLKSNVSITNIIEYETATSADKISDKINRFNLSIKKMIEEGSQNEEELPRVVFLYDQKTVISVNEVKMMVNNTICKYLDKVVVDYYDESGNWFDTYFKE